MIGPVPGPLGRVLAALPTQGELNDGPEPSENARNLWEQTVEALPRVGVAVGVAAVFWLIGRGVRWVLRQRWERTQTPSFALVMSRVAGFAISGFGVLLGLAVAFPSVKPVDLLAGAGILSVALGFAFQDILSNLLAGVLLLFRQPFRSGDQVEVNDRQGVVEGITIRETRIRTFAGELLIIPNADVYTNEIVVLTDLDIRRSSFVVGVAYEADLDEAVEVATAAMRGVEGVAPDPPAEALLSELGAATVNLECRFWAASRQHDVLVVASRTIAAVKRAFDDAEIEMPSDIVALQATDSFRAALQGEPVTPGGAVARRRNGQNGGRGGRSAPDDSRRSRSESS